MSFIAQKMPTGYCRVGCFEKVSFEQFRQDCRSRFGDDTDIRRIWERISIPVRKDEDSAAYDILCPVNVKIMSGSSIVIPTGLRLNLEPGWMMNCFPHHSLKEAFKIRLSTVGGIIDSSYYFTSTHNGHILLRVAVSEEGKGISLAAGEKFAQGVICPYGIA